MGHPDHKDEQNHLSEHQRASLWEYGLIIAGLAIVVVFGTQSIGRTVREPYAKPTIDQTTTSSISGRKQDVSPAGPLQPDSLRP